MTNTHDTADEREAARSALARAGASQSPSDAPAPAAARPRGGRPEADRDPDAFAPGFTARSAWMTLAVMTVGMVSSALNATSMNTSLAVIMNEYGVSPSVIQWVVTSYMLCLGAITPLSAHLLTRFRVRTLFCAALGIFCCGAAIGAVQHNFALFIVGRCIQAVGSGISLPTLQIVTFRVFPYHRRGEANGVTMAAVGIAPAVGPVLAGLLTDTIGWRSIFVVTGALSLVSMGLSWLMLRRLHDVPDPQHLDIPSFVLSTLTAVGIVFGCANLGTFGAASPLAWGPAVVGTALLAVFVRRELAVHGPLLNVRALRCGPFALTCGTVVLTQGWILAVNGMVCLYVQDVQGVSATLSGLTMLPGAVVSMVVAPLAGRVLDHHGPRRVVTVGFALMILATWLLSGMTPETPLWQPTLFQTVRFAGTACLQQILMTWGISQLGNLTQGTAMANSVRQLGGSATNALFFSIMDGFMVASGEGVAITDTFVVMNVTQLAVAAVVLGLMYTRMQAAATRA